MKSLEDREHSVQILLIETDPVVGDRYLARSTEQHAAIRICRVDYLRAHSHDRQLIFAVELECISNQVLQQLAHLHRIAVDDWQVENFHAAASLGEPCLEVR